MKKIIIKFLLLTLLFNILLAKAALGNAEPYFIKSFISTDQAVIGEEVILRYYLYSDNENVKYRIIHYPVIKNGQKKFVKTFGQFDLLFVGNKKYWRFLVYESKIYPLVKGMMNLGAITLAVDWYDPENGFKEKELVSQNTMLNVLPLPPFKTGPVVRGLVGDFEINLETRQDSFKEINFKFEIYGLSGALEFLEAPSFLEDALILKYKKRDYPLQDKGGHLLFTYHYDVAPSLFGKSKEILFYYYSPKRKRYIPFSKKITFAPSPLSSQKENEAISKAIEQGDDFYDVYRETEKILSGKNIFLTLINLMNLFLLFFIIFSPPRSELKKMKTYLKTISWNIKRGKNVFNQLRALNLLIPKEEGKGTQDKKDLLMAETFRYFRELYQLSERSEFSKDKTIPLLYKRSHFKRLAGWIREYESHQKFKRNSK